MVSHFIGGNTVKSATVLHVLHQQEIKKEEEARPKKQKKSKSKKVKENKDE